MFRKTLFLLLFSFSTFFFTKEIHPYHVGSVEIKYNEQSQTFEISATLFLDDLERTLGKKFKKPFNFHSTNAEQEIDFYLSQYFLENLKLKINDQSTKIHYIGFEEAKESVNIYLETEKTNLPKKVEVTNTLLYDYAHEQLNIIHVVVNNVRKSYRLEYPQSYVQQDFK